MAKLVLYPRLAPQDRIRLWLGAFDETQKRLVSWTLNGVPAVPETLREFDSARPEGMHDGNEARAFTGVYEFVGLDPSTTYDVTAHCGGESVSRRVATLPTDIPAEGRGWFNILLVSCFHKTEAEAGVMERVIARIEREMKPSMTLLMGDQVYLDLPTLRVFKNDKKWLAKKFEQDYISNWGGPSGMAAALAVAPSVAMPDDHEYWNNFPHASPFVRISLSKSGRDNWRAASQALYEGFQLHRPGQLGDAVELDVGPLSLYVADTRSLRNKAGDDHRIFTDDGLRDVLRWCAELGPRKKHGLFVTGQSMFAGPASWVGGTVADKELSNYADCKQVVRALADNERDLICITGDVHWGRFVRSRDPHAERNIYEVITSPSALVTSVGSDQVANTRNFLRGLFGRRKAWPRHSDAPVPESYWHQRWLGNRFRSERTRAIKGDQVAVLSFCRAGQRVLARVTWYPIHSRTASPIRTAPFPMPRKP